MVSAGIAGAALSAPVQAEDNQLLREGWYGTLLGGGNFMHDADASAFTTVTLGQAPATISANGETDFKAGFMGALTGGYKFGNGLRGELELAVRNNPVSNMQVGGGGDIITDDGALTQYAIMGNVYYDFKLDNPSWVPYVGLGAGVGISDVDSLAIAGAPVNDTDVGFAWQAKMGVRYAVEKDWSIGFGYTFFRIESVDLRADDLTILGTTVGGKLVDDDALMSHSALISASYHFPAK